MKSLSRFFDRIIDYFAIMGAGLCIVMMLGIFTDVILRFFFNKPNGWVVEYAEYSLLYITFLSAAWVLREQRHVKLDLMLERMNPRKQDFINGLTSGIGMVVFMGLAWYALASTQHFYDIEYRMATSLRTLKWPIIAVIPLGSLLISLQFLRMSISNFKSWKASIQSVKRSN